jgi:hypothetical protein
MANDGSFSDKVKEHWLPVVAGVCVASLGAAWTVAQSVAIGPRDYQIAQLEKENASLKESLKEVQAERPSPPPEDPSALAETGVAQGTSVTTSDGRLSILVESVISNSVRLSTRLDSAKPVVHDLLSIGDRVTVEASDKVYYIDLRRARSGMLDMSVSQRRK